MLSIQPISFNYQNSHKLNNISFKGEDIDYDYDYDAINQEDNESFWKEEARKFEEMALNENNPKVIRKGYILIKNLCIGFAAASAVIWGGNRAAKELKTVYTKFKGGKVNQTLSSISKPVKEGFKTAGVKVKETAAKLTNKFLESPLGQKISTKYNELYNNNKFVKFASDLTKKGAEKIVKLAKDIKASIKGVSYDEATKTASSIMGTGAGVAGMYEGIRKDIPVNTDTDSVELAGA